MDFVKIHTFGCKVNTYDSGLIEQRLKNHALSPLWPKQSPIHILNTCAVTGEATKEALRSIRRLKVKDPLCTVVVTGCSAQVDTGAYENLSGADLVIANSHKSQMGQILDQYFKGELREKVFKSNIFHKEDLEAGGGVESNHTRSFLKIQDGCNSFCSYCIIPFARGKSRSIARKDLVQRTNELYRQGVREVVLTGVHIGDYEDGASGLEDLIEDLLVKTEIQRFRLSSLEPVELSPRLLALYKDPRMCPHFHMSIQSGASKVLTDMRRNYSAAQVEECFQRIHEELPRAFVGMDVIVGFPTETEELFLETFELLQRNPWSRIHVFPYSERNGTRAEKLYENAGIPVSDRKNRGRILRELSYQRQTQLASREVGQVHQVLGLTDMTMSRQAWTVDLKNSETLLPGQEALVQITGFQVIPEKWDVRLLGELT